MSEIKRKQYEDDITVENGSVIVFRSGRTGEIMLKVERVSGGSYNELRIYGAESEVTTTGKLMLLHGAIGDMLAELHKRGVRS